jgi:integrase
MTPLHQALTDYLHLRRSLGYHLARTEKLLQQFTGYLEATGAPVVTIENAVAWACLPVAGESCWWTHRLSAVRGFARYLHSLDGTTPVPAADLLPWRSHRAHPYLYGDADIVALIDAATQLRWPLRVATYQTLIGLLAVTGMRVGEAIGLDTGDLHVTHGVLLIRHAKFDKTRELPLHPTTVAALQAYLARPDRCAAPARSPALLISPAGTRLLYCNVQWTFQRLVQRVGLASRAGSCRPRLHDLRHSFAIRTLLDAYRQRQDPQQRLTLLSTYLGHVNPAATYWYLSAAPELLAQAADRLDQPRGVPR